MMASPSTVQPANSEAVVTFLQVELERAAEAMQEQSAEGTPRTLRPLHHLQAWCERAFMNSAAGESRILLYVLSRLLEDAFDNLTGDFLYDDDSDRLRAEFFSGVSESILELAVTDPSDAARWQSILNGVLQDYMSILTKLDMHVEALVGGVTR